MPPKRKNLLVRTATGAVYIALMIAGVFCYPLMAVLMCVLACLAIREFMGLTSGPADQIANILLTVVAATQFIVLLIYGVTSSNPIGLFEMIRWSKILLMLMPLLLLFTIVAMSITELFRNRPCPIEHIGQALFGLCWIVFPLGILTFCTSFAKQFILAFFLVIWCYDTFAYLGGSLYGKTKMCQRISPKKTWEGTVTGLLAAVILAIVLPSIPFFGHLHIATGKWVVFALIAVVFGTFGDLLESCFKRRADVKDSSHILPGHGGILDRLDSMLFSAIPAILFAYFVMLQ